MSLTITPIRMDAALEKLKSIGSVCERPDGGFAICVTGKDLVMHGVIVMYTDAFECKLVNMWTDNTALVGSILYGAAWRAAKALGFKTITI